MQNRIPIMIFLLSLWMFTQTNSSFANEEKVVQDNKGDTAANEIMKTENNTVVCKEILGSQTSLRVGLPPGMRMKKMKTKRQECLFAHYTGIL